MKKLLRTAKNDLSRGLIYIDNNKTQKQQKKYAKNVEMFNFFLFIFDSQKNGVND